MQPDRRQRKVRRALAGGVMLGALSAVLLWLIELVYVLAVRRAGFDSTYDGLVFVQTLLAVPLALLTLVGAVQGLLILGVSQLTTLLASRRIAEPPWMALLYSLLLAPGIAIAAAQMFAGRHAQQIPGKDLLAIAIGLAGVAACYGVARLAIGVRDRFRLRRWGPRQANLLAPAIVLLVVVVYVADQRILPRLYPWFHVGLTIGAILGCQLAVAALHAGWRPTARWIGRLVEPSTALLVVVAVVGWGCWGLHRLSRSEQLRFLSHQHTVLQSKVLGLAGAVGLTRSRTDSLPLLADDPHEQPPSTASGPLLPDANLVLISIDALRADHMGIYGYSRPTTPHIDRWARQRAVVFARGYCPMPHTSFSLTSLMTGTHVYSAGGGQHLTLAAVLRQYGFKTAGFFPPAVFYIDGDLFGAYRDARFDFEYVKYEFIDARRRVDQVLAFLEEASHEGKRFFVWVHFFEPHEPYVFREAHDFGQRAIDRYDGEIAFVDVQVGRMIDRLLEQYPRTVIALTGDHGEAFGEHGNYYHGNSLYEEQIRVPAIISVPGVPPRRIPGAVQTVDLPVTLLALADIPLPASMTGSDLGPWISGEEQRPLPPAFVELDRRKAVIDGTKKLIKDNVRAFRELYDLEADPGEQRNLVSRHPALAARLEHTLARWSGRRSSGEASSLIEQLLARARKRDPGAAPGLIRLCSRDGDLCSRDLDERRQAIGALISLRASNALDTLQRATRDPDPEVRLRAQVGTALLGNKDGVGQIPEILRLPDLPPAVRRDALIALARSGDRSTAATLSEILDRADDIYERTELIEVLGQLGAPGAAPALRRQLKTLRTRRAAIDALGQLRARSSVPELIRSLRSDRFLSWRIAAARALGHIGDPRAVADLQHVAGHELEAGVVTWALAALGELDALAIPNVRSLEPRNWRCQGDVCELSLPTVCDENRELLLLAAPKPKRLIRARCGDQQVGDLDLALATGHPEALPPAPAAVIPLGDPAARAKPLRLRTVAPPPAIRFAGLRQIELPQP